MILVDTGPLVALFDRQDHAHEHCRRLLSVLEHPLITTIPVLTESFHILWPGSQGAQALQKFIDRRGLAIWWMDETSLGRAFQLMKKYADQPMDLADASLVAASEALATRRIFTLDRRDFAIYRAQRGHQLEAFEIIS